MLFENSLLSIMPIILCALIYCSYKPITFIFPTLVEKTEISKPSKQKTHKYSETTYKLLNLTVLQATWYWKGNTPITIAKVPSSSTISESLSTNINSKDSLVHCCYGLNICVSHEIYMLKPNVEGDDTG